VFRASSSSLRYQDPAGIGYGVVINCRVDPCTEVLDVELGAPCHWGHPPYHQKSAMDFRRLLHRICIVSQTIWGELTHELRALLYQRRRSTALDSYTGPIYPGLVYYMS
jgi:hypothetical protein